MPMEVLKPGGLIWASPSISHLSGSHLVFPRLYTCVAYMGSILVYLPLLFSLLSFSSFIKNPFSHKPHELKNRRYISSRLLIILQLYLKKSIINLFSLLIQLFTTKYLSQYHFLMFSLSQTRFTVKYTLPAGSVYILPPPHNTPTTRIWS